MLKTLANEEDKDEQPDLALESRTQKWLVEADILELYKREERPYSEKKIELNGIKGCEHLVFSSVPSCQKIKSLKFLQRVENWLDSF